MPAPLTIPLPSRGPSWTWPTDCSTGSARAGGGGARRCNWSPCFCCASSWSASRSGCFVPRSGVWPASAGPVPQPAPPPARGGRAAGAGLIADPPRPQDHQRGTPPPAGRPPQSARTRLPDRLRLTKKQRREHRAAVVVLTTTPPPPLEYGLLRTQTSPVRLANATPISTSVGWSSNVDAQSSSAGVDVWTVAHANCGSPPCTRPSQARCACAIPSSSESKQCVAVAEHRKCACHASTPSRGPPDGQHSAHGVVAGAVVLAERHGRGVPSGPTRAARGPCRAQGRCTSVTSHDMTACWINRPTNSKNPEEPAQRS